MNKLDTMLVKARGQIQVSFQKEEYERLYLALIAWIENSGHIDSLTIAKAYGVIHYKLSLLQQKYIQSVSGVEIKNETPQVTIEHSFDYYMNKYPKGVYKNTEDIITFETFYFIKHELTKQNELQELDDLHHAKRED
jgi:hypothetical protein